MTSQSKSNLPAASAQAGRDGRRRGPVPATPVPVVRPLGWRSIHLVSSERSSYRVLQARERDGHPEVLLNSKWLPAACQQRMFTDSSMRAEWTIYLKPEFIPRRADEDRR